MDQELLYWKLFHGIPDDAFDSLHSILSAYGLVERTSGNETLSPTFPLSSNHFQSSNENLSPTFPLSSNNFQSGSNLVGGSLFNRTFGNSVDVDGGSIFTSIFPSLDSQPDLASEHLQVSIAESFSQSSGLSEPIVPIPLVEGPIGVVHKDGIAEANIPKGRIPSCIKCWIKKRKVCLSLSCGLV
jgi:hypothetical protein